MNLLSQQSSAGSTGAAGEDHAIRPAQVLVIVCAGVVMASLDLFIVNVALPQIAVDLHEPHLGTLSWVLNGYAIIYAALLVLAGRLMGAEMAADILHAWLETDFAAGRHARRVDKIADIERRHPEGRR